MIRLKILIEQSIKKLPNVLFVTDNADDRRRGFAKQLISNAKITGDIRTIDKGSIAQLKDLVSINISSYYDLVVVITRGIYESGGNPEDGLLILDTIKSICQTSNIPLVINTIPSVQFVKSKFAKNINFSLANDAEYDRFIQNTADYVLDTSMFNDDSYFDSSGIYLTRQSHEQLYDEMIIILNKLVDVDDDTEFEVGQTEKVIAEPGSRSRAVYMMQQRLIEFGYEISDLELKTQKFGKSTSTALVLFKMKNGLNADSVLDKQTLNKLKTAIPDKIIKVTDKKLKIKFDGRVIKPSAEDIEFYSEVLEGIDAPVTENTLTFFFAWREAESGLCAFNPFATTQPYGNSTKFNTAGVRNYETKEDGIAATIKTLLNGYYPDLLDKLRNDLDPLEIATSKNLTTWGTGNLVLTVLKRPVINPLEITKTTIRIAGNKVDNADTSTNNDSKLSTLLGIGTALVGGIATGLVGGSADLLGIKILGNNIRISIPAAGSHRGQSGWQSGNAWDIGAPVGTPVYAVNSGTLVSWKDYGPKIISTNGKRLFGCGFTVKSDNSLPSVYYTHLKDSTVRKGSKVNVGDLLGYVMDFPGSPFDHLHIGISSGDISQFITKDGTIKRN